MNGRNKLLLLGWQVCKKEQGSGRNLLAWIFRGTLPYHTLLGSNGS